MESLHAPALADALVDIAGQVGGLLYPGFVTASGVDRLADIERYLLAVERRMDLLVADPVRDRARMARIHRLERAYRAAAMGDRAASAEARSLRWLLEELRVSIFAQALGTREPVSEERVRRATAELARR
jgi:ATP-dependent helicase HrpA